MSRSNPNEELVNPCKYWFQWDGGDGKGFKSYDKTTKKNNPLVRQKSPRHPLQ